MVRSREKLEEEYRSITPKSKAQWERGKPVMPGGLIKGAWWKPPYPIYMERGEDCYLWDLDGRKYVDFANHHTTMILGHSPASVVQALNEWVNKGIGFGAPVTLEAEIAEEICGRIPSVEKIRFTNSGSEASLHATRLVRTATGKPKIAKFEGAYHGTHDSLEISIQPPLDQAGPADAPNAVPAWEAMPRDCERDTIILPYNQPESVELILREHREELAAVFYEAGGGTNPKGVPIEFARFVRRITKELGLLMVLDEVVSFRSGYAGYQGIAGIKPDLTLFGKTIGGGLAAGALGGSASLMDLMDNTMQGCKYFQSGTFSGNALTMAAGLATLRALTPEIYDYLESLQVRMHAGLKKVFERAGVSNQVVSRGSMVSVFLSDKPVVDFRSGLLVDTELTHRLDLALMLKGYYTGNMAMILSAPMKTEHVDGLLEALEQVLEEQD